MGCEVIIKSECYIKNDSFRFVVGLLHLTCVHYRWKAFIVYGGAAWYESDVILDLVLHDKDLSMSAHQWPGCPVKVCIYEFLNGSIEVSLVEVSIGHSEVNLVLHEESSDFILRGTAIIVSSRVNTSHNLKLDISLDFLTVFITCKLENCFALGTVIVVESH